MIQGAYKSDKIFVPYAKIKDYILKPNSKHSAEFFAVGYTPEDGYKIFQELESQFDKTKATNFRYVEDGVSYNIYMQLGVKIRRLFKTIWQEDNLAELPRFISAYRVRGVEDV